MRQADDYKVDWGFIEEAEGRRLVGYVPTRFGLPIGQSGVTIATGFDIGQRGLYELRSLGLPGYLCEKFAPYCLKRRWDALRVLKARPLRVSDSEASLIDRAVRSQIVNRVAEVFEEDTKRSFLELSPEWQTVVASLAYNLGPNLRVKYPTLWAAICLGDTEWLLRQLRTWTTNVPGIKARRMAEARLLERMTVVV